MEGSGRRDGELLSWEPPGYAAPVAFVVTCAVPRDDSGGHLLGDEEECVLRDNLLAVHPKTVQPETLNVLLRRFVTGPSSPGA